MIGSSAGVMAVLIFMCSYMPYKDVRILVFNIKLIYIGLFFVVLDLIQIPVSNAGGHLAHLGGAMTGYIYQRNISRGNDIGQWISNIASYFSSLFSFKRPRFAKYIPQQNPNPNKINLKSIKQKLTQSLIKSVSQDMQA
ncbi:MAG: hypothetical protein CM15mP32_1880 [Flavobacteriaceae bacterium]|nr:MAG: hypothetical protein CM15mP32_1880 [Flavobacteriaceae bacterium]